MQEQFKNLLEILALLRGPQGCPWDRAQTLQTMRSCLLEETWEVLDAINQTAEQNTQQANFEPLKEELGDLLLNVLLLADIANAENGSSDDGAAKQVSENKDKPQAHFDGQHFLAQLLAALCQKLISRHPHVFAPELVGAAANPEEALKHWHKAKSNEIPKAQTEEINATQQTMQSALSSVHKDQTALLYALKLQKRAAKSGFDWPSETASQQVGEKIQEELKEFYEETSPEKMADGETTFEKMEEELGDILFSAVNLAQVHSINPELALMRSSDKFRSRFQHVEKNAERTLSEIGPQELEQLWQQAKRSVYPEAKLSKQDSKTV